MKYLFVHQNFPGQYLHIVRHLQADPANDVVFITEANANQITGVRRVVYDVGRKQRSDIHSAAREFELAAHRADKVAAAARQLRMLGFTPDIIIGHHGWGELLNLVDVWPGVPMLGYFEFYYHDHGYDVNFDPEFPMNEGFQSGVRAMNVINHLALSLGQHGQTPTVFQRDAYPDWAQPQIKLLPEGTRLDLCKPNPAAHTKRLSIGDFHIDLGDRLITYVARNLEPYRGYHTIMRALPEILKTRPDAKVVMLGGDETSYGPKFADSSWKDYFIGKLAGQYDTSRVLMPGQVDYDLYLKLLQRSDAHVYLTYPFVASWSLREALACGCVVIAADVSSVTEFVSHDRNGLLVPALDHARLARQVLDVLEAPKQSKRLRRAARKYAEAELDMDQHIAQFEARIAEITSK